MREWEVTLKVIVRAGMPGTADRIASELASELLKNGRVLNIWASGAPKELKSKDVAPA